MKVILELSTSDLIGSGVNKDRSDIRMSDFVVSAIDYQHADEVRYKDRNGGVVYFKRSDK